ncbi:hsp90 co-chaperone Cdc37 [Tieghemiomyces parasiticus]|uniref:Hsp90 chaperone protein kinase-targeting subunit n=1 Tax=Tieghemiomyces parasiticus TaxID=78921 RepID=A0A9W8DXX4_9FUNG|nr:hsp90 co-chaperone Cdc37 [Tieghemiomyces parasiticus]
MPLNYSKWDNIELSDDEDVEVHPNVDKRSFIRARQEAIHRERQERDAKIQGLTRQIQEQTGLLQDFRRLQEVVQRGDAAAFQCEVQRYLTHFQDRQKAMALAQSQAQAQAKVGGSTSDKNAVAAALAANPALAELSHDDLLGGLLNRIHAEVQGSDSKDDAATVADGLLPAYGKQLAEYADRFESDLVKAKAERERLEKEKRHKISTDELCRDGFSHSAVNKAAKVPTIVRAKDTGEARSGWNSGYKAEGGQAEPSNRSTATTTQAIEVLNPESVGQSKAPSQPSSSTTAATARPKSAASPQLTVEQIVEEFTHLKNLDATTAYISKYPNIVDESISDEILVKAFEAQMSGDATTAKRAVHQALILQYCARLGRDGVSLFIMRYRSEPRARAMFEAEVQTMYDRIRERSAVLLEERRKQPPQSEDVESIQLQSDDPNATVEVDLPDESVPLETLPEGSEERQRRELYEGLPDFFRDALKVGTLEAVNQAFAKMPGAEADKVLEKCMEGQFISIAGEKIVDPFEEEIAANAAKK